MKCQILFSWKNTFYLLLKLSMLGTISADIHCIEIFSYFSKKTCVLKCQILFSWKNKKKIKKIVNLSSVELAK